MLTVAILSQRDLLFDGRANHVVVPGEQGVFEICPFHRPLVSRLLPGVILVDDQPIPIQRGVVKVERDTVTVLVEPDVLHVERESDTPPPSS